MRLIEWDTLSLLIRGERLQSFVRSAMESKRAPIDELQMRFAEGELRLLGKVRVGLPFAVPFEVAVRRVVPDNGRVRMYLENASAFGFVPVPKLLMHLAGGSTPEGIELDPASGSIAVALDRFLPPFVDAVIEEVRIVGAGLAVRLGPGGADPPADFGGVAS